MRSPARLVALLFVLAIASTGCATKQSGSSVARQEPLADRAAFIERRAEELVRRGVPKDQAVAHASGEWSNQYLTAVAHANNARRAEQHSLESDLTKMLRDPAGR